MKERLYDRYVGTWWNDSSVLMWEIGGDVYALDGWNGEEYLHCWKVSGDSLTEASEEEYTVRPVYNDDGEIVDYVLEA